MIKKQQEIDLKTVKKDGNIISLFGLSLTSTGLSGVLKAITSFKSIGKNVFIATPNPEFVVFAHKHRWFQDCLNQAQILIPDGIGLVWASIFKFGLKNRLKRITGVDLTEKLCALAAENNQTVYFYGGVNGVAERAFVKLQLKYPRLRGWAESGPKLNLDKENGQWDEDSRRELAESLVTINQLEPDYLFVALGMGKQEKFICDLWPELKAGVAVGVGGSFDYLSGKTKRAPGIVKQLGFEWLYRLFRQPWRVGRQKTLLQFISLTLQEIRSK